jgi:hypothetical protein
MNNDVFRKALRLLAHPASIAALATLLINDHLLRRLWPSWFTGKLGDFAWLTFMPFVAAALIALLAGRRARSRWVGVAACLLIGGVFALAKTVSAAHTAVVGAASTLFGFPVGWRRDPTDLIALVSVVAAWRLWQADERRQARRMMERAPARVPARAAPLLAAALFLTVANSPAPDYGINRIEPRDGILVACSSYSSFASADGGMTWTILQAPTPLPHPTLPPNVTPTAGPTPTDLPTPTLEPGAPTPIPYTLAEACRIGYGSSSSIRQGVIQGVRVPPVGPAPTPAPTPLPGEPTPTPGPTATPSIYLLPASSGDVRYRFQPDNWIQRSEDGGETWTTEYQFNVGAGTSTGREPPAILQDLDALLRIWTHQVNPNRSRTPGPLGGFVDPVSGHVIFSMGFDGVLVRDSEGNYHWVPVGDYRRGGL